MAEPAYLAVGRTTQGIQRTGQRITLRVEIWSGSAAERLVGKKAGNAELRDEVAFFRPRRGER